MRRMGREYLGMFPSFLWPFFTGKCRSIIQSYESYGDDGHGFVGDDSHDSG